MQNRLFHVLIAAFIASAAPTGANAQSFPTRAITIVVPTPAGGGVDFIARLLSDELSSALAQPVVISNISGANGNIGTAQVARANADGYTLLFTNSGNFVTNPALYLSLTWDPVRDFKPVAMAFSAPFVLVASSHAPFASLREMIAYAKENPSKINYGSPGIGSGNHIGIELLSQLAGITMTHVPYRGASPAAADLASGAIDIYSSPPQAIIPLLQNQNVRALAISRSTRHPLLPYVPTAAEAGAPDWEEEAWYGLFAPAQTPDFIVDRLTREMKKIVNSKTFEARAIQSGGAALYMTPAELAATTQHDLKFWSQLIGKLNIRLE